MRIIGNDPTKTRQTSAIASGTLPSGKPVVVNADGTVSVVSTTTISEVIGSATTYETGSTDNVAATYDSVNNKVIIAYRDQGNSFYGTAIVGTVSGTSISFGTPQVFRGNNCQRMAITFDVNAGKCVIAYRNATDQKGEAVVGTVSGTSITFGSTVIFNTGDTDNSIAAVYDPDTQQVVIAYRDQGNSSYATAVVGSISGTSISFGSEVVIDSANTTYVSLAYDTTNNKVVVIYAPLKTSPNCWQCWSKVGTVSGNSISFGSGVRLDTDNTGGYDTAFQQVVFDPVADKIVAIYRGTNQYGQARVGYVNGTYMVFQSLTNWTTDVPSYVSAYYDSVRSKVGIAYSDQGNSNYGTQITGEVSGTSITFGSPSVFLTANTQTIGSAFNTSDEKAVIAFRDASVGYGKAVVIQNSGSSQNLTSENYIGTAKSGAADGDGVVVNTQGTVSGIPETFYDIANASYDSVSFSVTSQDESPQAFAFSADGTKMYVGGSQNNTVYQYTLSTAWDLSTASYASKSFSYSGQETGAQDIAFKTDGTKMFITGTSSDAVNEYALSTAWDVSTASFTVAFSVSSQDVSPQGVTFNPNGTQMYVTGNVSNAIFEYTLSTAWDVSTASYASKSLSVGTEEGEPRGVEFNSDGTKVFITGSANDSVFQYNLTTAFDLSTGSYSNVSFAISEDGESRGPKFKSDGSKMYILGFTNDSVFQYTTLSDLTAGQSYYVQTDGTLSTTAGDPSVFAGTAVSATKLIVKG